MLKGLLLALLMLAVAGIGKLFQGKKDKDQEKKDGWVCSQCSHMNPAEKGTCERCGAEKK